MITTTPVILMGNGGGNADPLMVLIVVPIVFSVLCVFAQYMFVIMNMIFDEYTSTKDIKRDVLISIVPLLPLGLFLFKKYNDMKIEEQRHEKIEMEYKKYSDNVNELL